MKERFKELIGAENQNIQYFWDKRCERDGHTGWSDDVIYKYDQPLRLKVIRDLITKIQGDIKNKKILDGGCGVGDFSIMFAKMGADVLGIDVSEKAIKKAKDNAKAKGVLCNFLVTSIKDICFPLQQLFDVILSITVLQHIPDDELSLAVQKMVNSLKREGYIYIMETAPIALDQDMVNSEYQYIHTKEEWIKIFECAGAKLYFEMIYPQFGISLIRNKVVNKLYHKIMSKNNRGMSSCSLLEDSSKLFRTRSLVEKMILTISKPIDHYVLYHIPFLSIGVKRIMVFQKVMKNG